MKKQYDEMLKNNVWNWWLKKGVQFPVFKENLI